MTQRPPDLFRLFLVALIVQGLVAWPLSGPPYMDAAYYAVGGRELAAGRGFNEPFVWNYLDAPASLPHPGYLYWMPLPALLAGLGGWPSGGAWRGLQVPFLLLAALLPLLAYAVAWSFSQNRRHAWAAGLLMLLGGFYAPYWTLPESFTPYALVGGVTLWQMGSLREGDGAWKQALLIGGLTGLAHLTRADGPLLLLVALLVVLGRRERGTGKATLRLLTALLGGYLLVMVPWFLRNLRAIGLPLSPAGSRTLWLRAYDELFNYGDLPTLASFLAWGVGPILRSRLEALVSALQTLIAVHSFIFLAPFVVVGLWRHRRHRLIRPALVYALLLYAVMTLAFTYPGMRGGLFHSGGALLPFFLAVALGELDRAVGWAAERIPTWERERAQRGFTRLALIAAALLSLGLYLRQLIAWSEAGTVPHAVGTWLQAREGKGADALELVVMINDPPSFTYYTGYPAVAIPNGPPAVAAEVARRYGVRYLVLEEDHPQAMAGLYAGIGYRVDESSGWILRAVLRPRGRPVRIYEWVTE